MMGVATMQAILVNSYTTNTPTRERVIESGHPMTHTTDPLRWLITQALRIYQHSNFFISRIPTRRVMLSVHIPALIEQLQLLNPERMTSSSNEKSSCNLAIVQLL